MSDAMQLELARKIAADAHKGQKDKAGGPFVKHCERVAEALPEPKLKAIAYLHDVVEKSDAWSLERLARAGLDRDILCAVDALTRRPAETDTSHLCRVFENELAHSVKVEEIRDNLALTQKAGRDTARYESALEFLVGVPATLAPVAVQGGQGLV